MSHHQPRKRFGQHFLTDQNVIDGIVAVVAPQPSEYIIEIGPGRGAITTSLVASGAAIEVIEIDRDLATWLTSEFAHHKNLSVRLADVLDADFQQLIGTRDARIVGNLPYNISTPLILKLLEHAHTIVDMTFMLQKEVVDRLAAAPSSKQYGRLSVMVQSECSVEALFEVAPQAFDPPPKVISKIVRISPQGEKLSNAVRRQLEICVRIAFSQRRKTLRNTLGKVIPHDILRACDIELQHRAEDVSVASYVRLANAEWSV